MAKKTFIKAAAEVIDHIVHPENKVDISFDPASGPDESVITEIKDGEIISIETSSSENSELQNHPKFDKFKKGDN